uniref:PR domain zinc finger protein 10 n=1 Tax=Oncorhynchus kisutch TaxID=8019 RepID=A0A8C7ICW7_ONCKI
METKQETSPVWNQAGNSESGNTTQVHFEGGTVAQIVYSGDQQDRGQQQQVVYTADGNSYTSVESAEHTLVYIHPADGSGGVFSDQPQVAYIQQDGTTQQVTVLLPSGQNMNAANLHVLSNVAEAPQALLEPVTQVRSLLSDYSLPSMAGMVDPSSSPLGATSTEDSDEEDDDEDDSDLDDWEPSAPQAFTPHNLWCEECNISNTSVCVKHGALHPIPNRPVVSRARASLPLVLYIDRFLGGVFSKRRIPKRTQFGPVEGPLVRQGQLHDHYIHLKVKLSFCNSPPDMEKSDDMWVDLSDEDICNWLMFVRPAQNHLEQNLVAYQYGSEIFYTTIKNIQPKQELKVWYAASYAEFVNQKIHDVTDEERKVLREQEKNWPCYECNRRFMSSEQLQQHLNMHDDKLDCVTRPKGRARGRGRKRFGTGRRPGRPPKFIRLDPSNATAGDKTPVRTTVKKHVRSFHSEKIFQCSDCDKAFCRPDKLRLHMLRHSDRKDFLCSTCGKQFKRKDKLREHMQRMHNPEREAKKADRIHRSKALKQKVPTTDLESFMFKCRMCMMGFRRRGMLVNHLSKRHPEMRIEEVPELTLPIIKPNRDYFCQYCDKVYKSASKRKAHILKNHPGAELPPSIRKLRPAVPGEPDPMLSTHTQLTGTIATAPVCCPHCAKQYSSKTKMVQHIRKKHPEYAQLANTIQAPLTTAVICSAPAVITTDGTTSEAVVTTDLLTQAMTELSQTLTTDYRTAAGDYQRIQYIPVSQSGGGINQPQHIQLQVVQVQAGSPHSQHSTVDVSQLHDPHGYSQHSIQVQHIQVSEAGQNTQGQPLSPSSQVTQELSPAQLTPVTLAQSHALQTSSNQQGSVQHAYIPGNWNYRGYREYHCLDWAGLCIAFAKYSDPFVHIVLRYSLILKWIKLFFSPSTIYTQHPIMTSQYPIMTSQYPIMTSQYPIMTKQNRLRAFCKCILKKT